MGFSQTLDRFYNRHWSGKRAKRLAQILADHLPPCTTLLDAGCGKGDLAFHLSLCAPHTAISACDTVDRFQYKNHLNFVHQTQNDRLPFADNSFDVVTLNFVLHHTDDYLPLLAEAKRVSRRHVVIMDHTHHNIVEYLILCAIDIPGNIPAGIYTPFNYKTPAQWTDIFAKAALAVRSFQKGICWMPAFLKPIFVRKMHFVAVLEK